MLPGEWILSLTISPYHQPNTYTLLQSKLKIQCFYLQEHSANVDHFHARGQLVYHLISCRISLALWGMVGNLKSESSQGDLNQER